ncbi:MAG: gliding motility protein GldM [Bacteroidales bacterium]|nr:gliding motility protein GldM [Candidatus Sodaliphilus limicaballi]
MASGKNQSVSRMSPRQRMINLMYIVLTAMLALNESSAVLNGFSQVADALERSNRTITARNVGLYQQLQAFNEKNPGKGKVWLDKATDVRAKTDKLYSYIDSLKYEIVRAADGDDADVNDIVNRDNLDAASQVMLAPGTGKGKALRARIDQYRSYIIGFLDDEAKRKNVAAALSTTPPKTGEGDQKLWEETMFENMPAIAAVTLLSTLQNSVRYAEGEVLNQILTNVDMGDLRVNLIDAFVVPQSRIVMRGTKYSANIVLAAVDTTQRPVVYINGHRLNNDRGLYEVGTGAAGNYDYSGYIEVMGRDGSVTKREFKSSYTVIDPLATVSATMMNVLYAGINNPISIAVPGVPENSISATMTNGTLTKSGNGWIAHPTKVGAECEITVSAEMDGQRTNVGSTKFRVRKLPDPMPFIAFKDANGNPSRYKGGRPFPKATLLSARGVDAAIDDDILNIDYKVLSFETVFFDSMGNAIPELSSGSNFSERQLAAIRRLQHGKRFYISHVKAVGPDGITRDLAPIEVIIN